MLSVDQLSGGKILSELTWKAACVTYKALSCGTQTLSPAYFKNQVLALENLSYSAPSHFSSPLFFFWGSGNIWKRLKSRNYMKQAVSLYRSVLRIWDRLNQPLNENVLHFYAIPAFVRVLVWNSKFNGRRSGWLQQVEGWVYRGTFFTVKKKKEKGERPF